MHECARYRLAHDAASSTNTPTPGIGTASTLPGLSTASEDLDALAVRIKKGEFRPQNGTHFERMNSGRVGRDQLEDLVNYPAIHYIFDDFAVSGRL
jgi:hypothetical protein